MQPDEIKALIRDRLAFVGPRIHLVGVGGSGMSGLARLLLQHGHVVSGSDLSRSAEVERLIAEGVRFYQGHEAGNLGDDVGLLIYSSAIREDNAERTAAVQRKIPCARRAECLAVLAEQKEALIVAGMHGKTTTTSMTAHVLRSAGWRCSHYVGAQVPILGANAVWDQGAHFVIEGDESDGTIALYHPRMSLILNIEEEHLDYFGNLDQIMRVFRQLIDNTTDRVIYCADDKNSVILCSQSDRAVSFGFSDHSNYQAFDVEPGGASSRFKIRKYGGVLGEIFLNVPGIQNVSNAAGVVALASEIGVPWPSIVHALGDFRGASRRFEVKFKSADFMVVDDYAHHPTEIKATLAAAKNSGWKRVIALFQPHRYTRTKLLLDEFGSAFHDARHVLVTEIYAASETPLEGVSGRSVAASAQKAGHTSVEFVDSLRKLQSLVSRMLEPGDLVLTMGAGDIHRVAAELAEELTWFQDLARQIKPESSLLRQEPMAKHTTMRIGGPAQLWFEPCDEEDLILALRYTHSKGIPVTVVGRGSNLLVLDGGIRGLCIHLSKPYFSRITISDDALEAGAGVRLSALVAEAKKRGLGGFEFMEGIPGNLGGALRMNAGAMQGWTMEVVEEVRSLDLTGDVHVNTRAALEVRYRSVPHFQNHIAVWARLRGRPVDPVSITEKLKTFSEKRWGTQPAASSAGCIFKNPGPCPAGKLIDELGLKNMAVGHARVSEVHGNFIVNDGGASAEDVLQLIDIIKARAKSERHIDLETEVIVLGEPL